MVEREQDIVTVCDTVMWRGSWGDDPAKEATVDVIEAEADFDDRVGTPVDNLPWSRVPESIITLANGHWAFGCQIGPVTTEKIVEKQPNIRLAWFRAI